MATPLLTKILIDLKGDLGNTVYALQPVAIQLLMWFFMYELTTGLLLASPGTNPLVVVKEKLKVWAFLYALIYFFKGLMDLIESIFSYFAKIATNGGSNAITLEELPFDIINMAYVGLEQILDSIIWNKPATWILFVAFIVGLLVFAKVCLTVGMVVLEYLVMSSLVIILVPFMMFEKLRFVGDKVIGTLINLNMKIFVIRYLMSFFMKFLVTPLELSTLSGKEIAENTFYWLIAMAILSLMTMKGHEMAQTLISGVTSFGDSSELVGMARKNISTVGKRIGSMVTGAKTGMGAGKGAIAGAKEGAVKGSLSGGSIGGTVGAFLGGVKGGIQGGQQSYKRATKSSKK